MFYKKVLINKNYNNNKLNKLNQQPYNNKHLINNKHNNNNKLINNHQFVIFFIIICRINISNYSSINYKRIR